jgi:hypothetical protein
MIIKPKATAGVAPAKRAQQKLLLRCALRGTNGRRDPRAPSVLLLRVVVQTEVADVV